MGFHCGNTCSKKLASCEMKNQMIMARSLPVEVTNGTLEGDIAPGDITFYRLQSTSDNKLRAYVAQGEVLPVATRSFGSIGVFAIHEMGRFYRHVLIEKNYPHHGAVAFGHYGKALFEVFKYIGRRGRRRLRAGRSDGGHQLQPAGISALSDGESVRIKKNNMGISTSLGL